MTFKEFLELDIPIGTMWDEDTLKKRKLIISKNDIGISIAKDLNIDEPFVPHIQPEDIVRKRVGSTNFGIDGFLREAGIDAFVDIAALPVMFIGIYNTEDHYFDSGYPDMFVLLKGDPHYINLLYMRYLVIVYGKTNDSGRKDLFRIMFKSYRNAIPKEFAFAHQKEIIEMSDIIGIEYERRN